MKSTPAGSITVRESNSSSSQTAITHTLKCYADSKPTASVKWYKWKRSKNGGMATSKEELQFANTNNDEHDAAVSVKSNSNTMMNEIVVNALGRHDPNTYECVARNAVPPATSRIFYFEIQCKHKNSLSLLF